MPLLHLHHRLQSSLAVLLALSVSACQQGYSQPVRPAPLPQDDLIQVYTNHEPAARYTEPYRKQTRDGDDLEQKIVDAIAAAQITVDVAVQELRLPKIAAALAERSAAGVKVRVILENIYSRPFSTVTPEEIAKQPERDRGRYEEFRQLVDRDENGQLSQEEIAQGDALVILDRARVPRLDDMADGSAGSALMHHKFVVVDGRTIIVTSANFTTSDVHGDFKSPASRGNANNLLQINSPELAALFTQQFNIMWGDGPGGKTDSKFGVKKPFYPAQPVKIGATLVEVQFSPTRASLPWSSSSNGLIGKTLSNAKKSVDLALFVFSDQKLVNLLDPIRKNGTEVRGLIEPGFAYRPYSEALDMLGITLADDCKTEAENRPWQNPITTVGVPRLPPGDLLHNKFGIVDQETVITGSHNWTDAANTGNDETVLVVHSATVAAHYQREFERLYTNAILGIPPAIQKKVEAQRRQCQLNQPSPQPLKTIKRAQVATAPTPTKVTRVAREQKQLVNINTATQAELDAIPGISAKLAARIITARQQRPIKSLDDLDRISGVGPKLLKRLETQVTW
ncbi:helix-hairpin-helix domain-containing protein [Phormidium sp. FACHB-592]|uniref:phospholipase D n=1 Tax=Stenomitos frigidus AS-A4 TaxID=2933935 RepID=A0ABV0KG11_9CYAN|nr:helix-hairpin-helix domain-containing protein [Phormidium sp. FACHB-592]